MFNQSHWLIGLQNIIFIIFTSACTSSSQVTWVDIIDDVTNGFVFLLRYIYIFFSCSGNNATKTVEQIFPFFSCFHMHPFLLYTFQTCDMVNKTLSHLFFLI